LPFCHFTLKAEKPATYSFRKPPVTWGEHIRKKRLELGLFQKDVAREVQVHQTTVYNWEAGKANPAVRSIPRIIRFLGYAPYDPGASVGEKIRARRQALGLSQEQFAQAVGVDESTVVSPTSTVRCHLKLFLAVSGVIRREFARSVVAMSTRMRM